MILGQPQRGSSLFSSILSIYFRGYSYPVRVLLCNVICRTIPVPANMCRNILFQDTSEAASFTSNVCSVPLPNFSSRVSDCLRDGNVSSVWSELVNESAHYYMNKYPNMNDKSDYRLVGEKMWVTYPCIAHDGTEKWVGTEYTADYLQHDISAKFLLCACICMVAALL